MTVALDAGIAPLGGWDAFVRPGAKVLLKINLIGAKPPESGAVTHAEFVRAIARILKARGCEVWIGDSAGGAIAGVSPTAEAMRIAGMDAVAAEEGALVKNFESEGAMRVEPGGGRQEVLYLAKPAFEADVVVNLPKFKTHSAGVYTGAVKNLFGCIPGLRKATYHREAPDAESLGGVIADINTAIRPALHIMDGITAMHRNGPTAGEPYHAGVLLLSTDPLALDAVATGMIGLDIGTLPIFKASIARGVGRWKPEDVEVVGDFGAHPPKLHGFKLPKAMGRMPKAAYKALQGIIDFLKVRPEVDLEKCKDCQSCVDGCPVGAIDRKTKAIDYDKCIECMCCHELCMYKAVELKRTNRFARMLMK
jgi:uncharacterized protein (DUF362 family)/NAD-dependent dihydropyrimidine dehydrogenase PreA subunit